MQRNRINSRSDHPLVQKQKTSGRDYYPFQTDLKTKHLSGAAGAVGAPLPRSRSSIWRRPWWTWWPSWRLAADDEGFGHFEDDVKIFLDPLNGVLGFDEDVLHLIHRWLSWR